MENVNFDELREHTERLLAEYAPHATLTRPNFAERIYIASMSDDVFYSPYIALPTQRGVLYAGVAESRWYDSNEGIFRCSTSKFELRYREGKQCIALHETRHLPQLTPAIFVCFAIMHAKNAHYCNLDPYPHMPILSFVTAADDRNDALYLSVGVVGGRGQSYVRKFETKVVAQGFKMLVSPDELYDFVEDATAAAAVACLWR